MRITVADAISPSYFVAIAAVQLGFFKLLEGEVRYGELVATQFAPLWQG
jgi:hypothetical protein